MRVRDELETGMKEEEETNRRLETKQDKMYASGKPPKMPTMEGAGSAVKGKRVSDTQGAKSMFGMMNSSSKGFQPVNG